MSYRYHIIWVVLLIAIMAACTSESATANNDPVQQPSVPTSADSSNVDTTNADSTENTDVQPTIDPTNAGPTISADTSEWVASVNGVPITKAEYEAELARRLENSFAADPTAVSQQVLDTLIEQQLIEQAAPVLGVTVTDEDVQAEINSLRQELTDEEWQQALQLNGYTTEEEFAEAQRDALIAQRVRDAVLEPLSGTIPQVHARHIVVQTEQEANNILTRLQNGESFETIAQQESIDVTTKDRGGDLGWFTAEELMDNRLADVAFGLQEGQIAGPIATRIGYHVIQLIERAEREVEVERLPLLMENVFVNWLEGQYRAATIERYQ
ncbi:peptidylprolyl isomerase [Phototrophicus methaneseepsis]|uniref:Peptidylprolyl isomerase n=1 Tax=Phototrophicus methaneseepsis TaxID=2710758 RepID=A0A7S8EC27_9CHLR|nr:peptidylprolyl isomerase [Phototrophicus methaneseepsis]QPC84216.1 peptidylprolyl isomerase [Phototrophicus methaneseepsis]